MQVLHSCVKGVKRQTAVKRHDEVKTSKEFWTISKTPNHQENVLSLYIHVEFLENLIKRFSLPFSVIFEI